MYKAVDSSGRGLRVSTGSAGPPRSGRVLEQISSSRVRFRRQPAFRSSVAPESVADTLARPRLCITDRWLVHKLLTWLVPLA